MACSACNTKILPFRRIFCDQKRRILKELRFRSGLLAVSAFKPQLPQKNSPTHPKRPPPKKKKKTQNIKKQKQQNSKRCTMDLDLSAFCCLLGPSRRRRIDVTFPAGEVVEIPRLTDAEAIGEEHQLLGTMLSIEIRYRIPDFQRNFF